MTIDRRTFGKLVAATAGASALSMPFIRAAHAQEVAKLGVLLPLSGPLASLGNDVMRGFELAKNLVNEEGGVFGQPAELVMVDVPSSTEATSQATRLITSERVKVIMGSYASSISFAASQVAERNRVVYFEQGAVANDITSRGFKYLFRFIYPASELGGGAAKFMLETVAPQLGIENSALKVALLYEDSSYGTAVGESARAVLSEAGVNVVDATSYSYKTTDLSSMVQRYKQLQPDVLIVCQYTPDGILFWSAMAARTTSMSSPMLLATTSTASSTPEPRSISTRKVSHRKRRPSSTASIPSMRSAMAAASRPHIQAWASTLCGRCSRISCPQPVRWTRRQSAKRLWPSTSRSVPQSSGGA